MKPISIKIQEKNIGKVYSCIDTSPKKAFEKGTLLKNTLSHVPKLKPNAYAGFLKKSDLKENILWNILENETDIDFKKIELKKLKQNLPEALSIISDSLKKQSFNSLQMKQESIYFHLFQLL